MGRPKTTPDDRRDERLNLRLTLAERLRIEANAAFHNLSPSEYVRRVALARRLPASKTDQRAAAATATAFVRIGNNLNQLTHHANAGQGVLLQEILTTLARINGELDRLYDPPADSGGSELPGGGALLPG